MKQVTIMLAVAMAIVIAVSSCASQEQELSSKVDAFIKVSEYREATELVNAFILSNPSNPFGRELKTKMLLLNEDVPAAIEEYGKYNKLSQSHSRELLEQLMIAVKSSKLDNFVESILDLEKTEGTDIKEMLADILLASLRKQELSPSQIKGHISALRATGAENARTFFFDVAMDDKAVEIVRVEAIKAIGRLNEQEEINDLSSLLKDSSYTIRTYVAECLLWSGNYEGSDILLQYSLKTVKHDLPKQRSTKKSRYSYLTNEHDRALIILAKLAQTNGEAKQEYYDIINRMVKSKDWDDKLLDAVISIITRYDCPTDAIESLLLVINNYPGSSDQYCSIFKKSIFCLGYASKTPDQEKRIEEAFVGFVIRGCGVRREPNGERNTTKAAFECLEKMAPQRAKQLKSEIPMRGLRARGIS